MLPSKWSAIVREKIFIIKLFIPCRVLCRKVHYVNEFRLCVEPSDSWHQPDVQKISYNTRNVNPNETPAEIMKLNDHCLEHILSQLSLPDRIHFARTCTRFCNIYQGISPVLDKAIQLNIFERMTAWDVRDFFQLSGRHVKQIEGTIPQRHCKRVCNFIGTHCINLQSMRILSNKLTSENTFEMFVNLNCLENLELRGCSLTNQHLQALRQLGHLKKLDLSHNERLTGANMNNLPDSIESLTLNNCGIQPELLNEMLSRLSLLKELHTNCFYLSSSCIDLYCKSLEVLSITCNDYGLTEYKCIATLPSLKKLVLNIFRDENKLPPMLMQWLVKYKSNQLEHLEIRTPNCIDAETLVDIGKLSALRMLHLPHNDVINDRAFESIYSLKNLEEINMKYCLNITENCVFRLILACPKLQVLHLEGCVKITDKLLHNISKLRTSQYHRPLPIKINMSGSKVSQFTLPNVDEAAKYLIHVSYTVPYPMDADLPSMYDDIFNPDDDAFDGFESDLSFESDFE